MFIGIVLAFRFVWSNVCVQNQERHGEHVDCEDQKDDERSDVPDSLLDQNDVEGCRLKNSKPVKQFDHKNEGDRSCKDRLSFSADVSD